MAIEQIGEKFFVKVGGKRYGHRDTRRAAELLEAEAKVTRAKAKAAGHPLTEVKGPTCAEYAAEWLALCEQTKEDATVKVYTSGVRIFTRRFGDTPLKNLSIDPRAARNWVITESRGTQNIVRTMMNAAKRDGLVDRNPFANLGIKQSRGRKDLIVLTRDEVHEVASKAYDAFEEYGETMSAMILFAAYTGIRPGELFALEWKDIGEDELHVRQSLSVTGRIKRPKNDQGRIIVLPETAREAALSLPRYHGMPHVFATKTGRRMNRGALHRGWDPVRILAGRHGMDFYELRHFCATYLLNLGVSHADVAVQLGHTDGGALVMSTYGHPSAEDSRKRIKLAFAA